MFYHLLFAVLMVTVTSVNADKLGIEYLPDVTLTPRKIVYQSNFPLVFEVTSEHKDGSDICTGASGIQFGIIAVYGTNNGINIVPSWKEDPTKYKIDIYFMQGDQNVNKTTFDNLEFSTVKAQKGIYRITFFNNYITVVSKNLTSTMQWQPMNPNYLPDFIQRKYLSLSFFQPLQTDPSNMKVNQCNLILDYNGKYFWQPGPPQVSTTVTGPPQDPTTVTQPSNTTVTAPLQSSSITSVTNSTQAPTTVTTQASTNATGPSQTSLTVAGFSLAPTNATGIAQARKTLAVKI